MKFCRNCCQLIIILFSTVYLRFRKLSAMKTGLKQALELPIVIASLIPRGSWSYFSMLNA